MDLPVSFPRRGWLPTCATHCLEMHPRGEGVRSRIECDTIPSFRSNPRSHRTVQVAALCRVAGDRRVPAEQSKSDISLWNHYSQCLCRSHSLLSAKSPVNESLCSFWLAWEHTCSVAQLQYSIPFVQSPLNSHMRGQYGVLIASVWTGYSRLWIWREL